MTFHLHTFTFRSMNTTVETALDCDPGLAGVIEEETRDWFGFVEERFSRFRADSELSRINRLPGDPVLISDTMLEVLLLAEAYRLATDGIFQPLVGVPLKHWGYDADFDEVRQRPVPFRLTHRPAPVVTGELELDPVMKSVRLPPGKELDLGGLVKSWSVQRLMQWLHNSRGIRQGMINAGGDLAVWGHRTEEHRLLWRIGIQDPWNGDRDIGWLELSGGAAATSGILGRAWPTDQGIKHHIIDPRTMEPSASGVVQCTVTGPDLSACEVWSKVICILGAADGFPLFLDRTAGYEALYFTENGGIEGSPSLLSRMRR